MIISEFINDYNNHPVLFVGTGISLRYLDNSFTWDQLLEKISFDLFGNDENYLDIKHNSKVNGNFDYSGFSLKEIQGNRVQMYM